jgi:acyl-CoA synthetase (AMP-forming)/AMP-acid ligase II
VIQVNPSPTLEGLFRRVLTRQPDTLALLDPVNKARITGLPPKRLTFAQVDRAISALSAHFIEAGLPANSVIAIQLPNTVEFMLTVLAAHRAGLIVALLPLLWRQAGGIDGRAQSHRGSGDCDDEQDRRRQPR